MEKDAAPGLDRFGRFVNRRELRALERALRQGERAVQVLEATHRRRGLLAATDRRIVFVTTGWFGRKETTWSYTDVAGLKVVRSVDDATLVLVLRDGEAAFTACRKAEAEEFIRAVKARPPPPDAPLDFRPPGSRPKDPQTLRREQLDRMLRKGSITKAEHERMVRSLAD
jgi:hypothetical protein